MPSANIVIPVAVNRSTTDRQLNKPEKVATKKFGDVNNADCLTLREFYIEDILELSSDLFTVITDVFVNQAIKNVEKNATDTLNMIKLLKEPIVFETVRKMLEVISNKKADDFKNLNISDTLKIINGVKKVIDFNEIKELFFQVFPAMKNVDLLKPKNVAGNSKPNPPKNVT